MSKRITDHELPTSTAAEDRPLLGWGQLVVPPFVAGLAFALVWTSFCFGYCMSPVVLVGSMMWAWKVCDQIAEWRYTVLWEDSLKGLRTRPADDYPVRLRSALFTLVVFAILFSLVWAAVVLEVLRRNGYLPRDSIP